MQGVFSKIDLAELQTAHTGEIGQGMASSMNPDLILLDINLPGMNGFEVLKKLQAKEETKHIPVIALSSAATKSDIDKGLQAGFSSYHTKPFVIHELISEIESLLMKRQETRGQILKLNNIEPSGCKILLVEDNVVNQKMAAKLIEKAGYDCDIAREGKMAIEMFQSATEYCLILMDMFLPDMKGYEVAEHIRKLEQNSTEKIPIIALTADNSPELEKQCRDSGCDDFLTKPIDIKLLTSKIDYYLRHLKNQK